MIRKLTITPVSSNRKTGNIAVTGRDRSTCPTSCTFYNNGCYTTGRIDAYYARSQQDWTLTDMVDRLAEAKSDRLRDRVDGDVLTDGEIDRDYLQAVTYAGKVNGFRWIWGYTHVKDVTPADVPDGYVMNASCETPDHVADAIDRGLPVVVASDTVKHGDRIHDRPVVQCPATRSDAINCGTCGGSAGPICARPDRTAIVLFPLHGMAVKKARRAVENA